MCQPTQSIMICEDRGRTDVLSERIVVERGVSGWSRPSRASSFTPSEPATITVSRLSRRHSSQTQVACRSTCHGFDDRRSDVVICYCTSTVRLARSESSYNLATTPRISSINRHANSCIAMLPRCGVLCPVSSTGPRYGLTYDCKVQDPSRQWHIRARS